MNVEERRAREEYDRLNPWRPMSDAKPDGTVCELLFNDMVGYFDADAFRYFLDHDGNWYRIDPPSRVLPSPYPMNWRPAFAKLTPERRHYLKKQAARA
jgi:hypothetical protein